MFVRRHLGGGFHRIVAAARLDVGDVGVARCLGEHEVGAAAEQASGASRRDAEGRIELAAEDGLRLVALRDIDQVARQQLMLVKRRAIGFQRALVLDPALDEIERDLGQPPFRDLVQVFDIDDAVETHG
ncbi:MAG: hypothetical protein WAV02_15575 [Stellaceae bacterium]